MEVFPLRLSLWKLHARFAPSNGHKREFAQESKEVPGMLLASKSDREYASKLFECGISLSPGGERDIQQPPREHLGAGIRRRHWLQTAAGPLQVFEYMFK